MAQVSPDGRWWWDGTAWRPMPAASPRQGSARVWWIVGGSCLGVAVLAAIAAAVVGYFTWQAIKTELPGATGSGSVPAGFPSDFPAYPGAAVVDGTVSGTSPKTFRVTYSSPDGPDKVCRYYRSALSSGDYRLQASVTVPLIGSNCVLGFANAPAGRSGSVSSAAGASGGTRIVGTLNAR